MVAKTDVIRRRNTINRNLTIARQVDDIAYTAALNTSRVVIPKLEQDLAIAPGKPKRPIQWTSEKQRKAFFATNGFGRGIPTRRTGGSTKAWRGKLERISAIVRVSITNPNNYVRFVRYDQSGRRSVIQRMHRNTGWRYANSIIDRWRREYRAVFAVNLQVEIERRKR